MAPELTPPCSVQAASFRLRRMRFNATGAAGLSYTRRFNARHREWGRLFGDRYKSVLVESGGSDGDLYLRTLLDYIHLN